MQHQAAMGVVHRAADLDEEIDATLQRKLVRLAVDVQGLSGDILHHEVRPPILERTAFVHPRDVGVLQAREDLSLPSEALHQLGAMETRSQHFDRDFTGELLVVSKSQVHVAHAAAPEAADHVVRSDRARALQGRGLDLGRGPLEEVTRSLVRVKQREHEVQQRAVVAAAPSRERTAFIGRQVQRLLDDRLDSLPRR